MVPALSELILYRERSTQVKNYIPIQHANKDLSKVNTEQLTSGAHRQFRRGWLKEWWIGGSSSPVGRQLGQKAWLKAWKDERASRYVWEKYKWLTLAWEEDGKVGKDKIIKAPQALLKSLNLIFKREVSREGPVGRETNPYNPPQPERLDFYLF